MPERTSPVVKEGMQLSSHVDVMKLSWRRIILFEAPKEEWWGNVNNDRRIWISKDGL